MRSRRPFAAVGVLGLAAGLLVLGPAPPASAHQLKKIGPYELLVGWGSEPAYAGQLNSVQLVLSRGGQAVTDIGSLRVEVVFGTRRRQLSLEPTFDPDSGLGTPGDYRAWFLPTSPGRYRFHFTGTLGGTKVDASFGSGPTTFDDVTDPSSVQFPVKAPTSAEVGALVQREGTRLDRAITSERAARDTAVGSARLIGIVGVVAGALGLVAGVLALVSVRRRAGGA